MSTEQAAEGRGLHGEGSRRPSPGQQSTEVLHQTRKLRMTPATMAVGGFLIVGLLGYVTLVFKSRPGTSPAEVAKVAANADAAASKQNK